MRKLFGDRLKELRLEKEMTQEELANIFNTGKASISHYESNRRVPDANNIERYAEFFDTSTDYILGKSDVKNPEQQSYESKLNALVKDVERLSPESQEDLEKYMEFLKTKDKVDKYKDEQS